MKNLLLLLSFGIIILNVRAQSPEIAKATVRYKFTHLRDTTQKDKPYTENMILFLGQTSSAYKSYDRKLQDALMKKQIEQQMAEQKGSGNVNIKVTGSRPTTRSEIYQFPTLNKMMRKENLITPYLIEEKLPVINWKITADTATFATLLCQKATGHFAGRDYTAWFCPDLPFRAGPWKLNGLPGLIVEAYDTNKEVEFKFDGMEQVVASEKPADAANTPPPSPSPDGTVIRFNGVDDNQDPNMIALPANAVKTSQKEFDKLQAAMRKDPQAFMAAMGGSAGNAGNMVRSAPAGAAGPGGGGQIRSMSVNVGPSASVINNPLELPEKK